MEAKQNRDGEPLHDLTAFQRDLLVVIDTSEQDPLHGLGIKETIEEKYNDEKIHHGRLYPNLDTLVEMGFVSKGEVDQRTNSYEITRRGLAELDLHRNWISRGE